MKPDHHEIAGEQEALVGKKAEDVTWRVAPAVRDQPDGPAGPGELHLVLERDLGGHDPVGEGHLEDPAKPAQGLRAIARRDLRTRWRRAPQRLSELAPIVGELAPAATEDLVPDAAGGDDVPVGKRGVPPDVVPVPVAVHDPVGATTGQTLGRAGQVGSRGRGQHRIEHDGPAPRSTMVALQRPNPVGVAIAA